MPTDKHLEAAWTAIADGEQRGYHTIIRRDLQKAITAYLRSVLGDDDAAAIITSDIRPHPATSGYVSIAPEKLRAAVAFIESQAAALAEARERVEGLEQECALLNNSLGFAELAMASVANAAQEDALPQAAPTQEG